VRARPVVLSLLLVAVTAAMLWRGWGFYQLGLDQRVDHPDFRALRPSGSYGIGLGYLGTLLILANLLYLARRKHIIRLGDMRTWLDFHVFSGLLAAILAVFHAAFQLRTPVAQATVLSLAIVVVTGMVGRWLHAFTARLTLHAMPEAARELDERVPPLGRHIAAAVAAFPPTQLPANASLLRCLGTMPRWHAEARARREAVGLVAEAHPIWGQLDRRERRSLRRLVAEARRAASADVRSVATTALLRSWRSLHRMFALLMLLAVVVHVGMAWHYGYHWIFGS